MQCGSPARGGAPPLRGHNPYTDAAGMVATMQSPTPARAVPALALVLTVLAGCIGGSSDPITVENGGPPGGPGPYTFTANVDSEGDNYTWDMGDRLTVLYGKTVQHTYDLKDAQLAVTLKVRSNGTQQEHSVPLTLGTGQNANPTFVLDGPTYWAVVGEPVRFSAARSSDPDGDPLRYAWSCLQTIPSEKLLKVEFHEHPGVGAPYQTPPAGSVTSYLANYTLPAPDQVFPGDLCDALKGTAPSTSAATVEGAFQKRGKYSIFLLASDGAHPTVSGSFDIFVTDPAERPPAVLEFRFNATLSGGAAGALQPTCEQVPNIQHCDIYTAGFNLPLAGLQGWLNVTYTRGGAAGTPAENNVTWELRHGERPIAQGDGSTPDSRELGASLLRPGPYTVVAKLQKGLNAEVQIEVKVHMNLDPYAVY
jgi:hypothetical protein